MRYFSVCSGVEAASLAWMPLGWEAVAFSEIEPFPCSVLKERFPSVPNLGDMTKIHIDEKGDIHYGTADAIPNDGRQIDLIVGGTPCQDASVAGKRAGLVDGSRSQLAFTFTRLAYELAARRGLRWVCWENVPGCWSLNGGRDFAAFLSSLAGYDVAVPKGGWKSFGIARNATEGNFGLAYRCLDVQYARVDGFPRAIPQRRRRIFLVGHFGSWERAAEVLFEPAGLLGHNPPSRKTGKASSAGADGGTSGAVGFAVSSFGGYGESGCSGQLRASGGDLQGGSETIVKTFGIGNGQAAELLASIEDCSQTLNCMHETQKIATVRMREGCTGGGKGPLVSDNVSLTLGCNNDQTLIERTAGPVAFKGNGNPTGDMSCTITGDHADRVTDFTPIVIQKNQRGEVRAIGGDGTVPDVLCVHGAQTPICNSTHANPVQCANEGLENCVCYPINSMVLGKELKGNDRQTTGIGDDADPSPTLQANHHHCVAIAGNIIGRKAENGGNGRGFSDDGASYTLDTIGQSGVSYASSVRRLLPVECERLMGFPDNWTRIPWRGKPADQCPDAPRYKACGNSMGVNCMRWIGLGIQAVEDEI